MNISCCFLAVLNKLREKLSHLNLDHCDKAAGENHVCGAFVGQRCGSANLITDIPIEQLENIRRIERWTSVSR